MAAMTNELFSFQRVFVKLGVTARDKEQPWIDNGDELEVLVRVWQESNTPPKHRGTEFYALYGPEREVLAIISEHYRAEDALGIVDPNVDADKTRQTIITHNPSDREAVLLTTPAYRALRR